MSDDPSRTPIIGATLIGFLGMLLLIGWAISTWPRPVASSIKPVTEVTSPPKDGWTTWNDLFEPALTNKYHLRFVDINDKTDWFKLIYVTSDNKKCEGKFFSYANDPWLLETNTCVQLV
jgi:hypothetical protein